MQNSDDHQDHSHATHTATCDESGCEYIAEVHAHEAETASHMLSLDLANHNEQVHGLETDPEKIVAAVAAKMREVSH